MSRMWGAVANFGLEDIEIGRQSQAMLDYAKAVTDMVENHFRAFEFEHVRMVWSNGEVRPVIYDLLLVAFLAPNGAVPKALLLTTKTTQGGYPYVREFLSDAPADEDVISTLERFMMRLASGEIVVP